MERVDLTHVFGNRPRMRWHTGWLYGPYVTVVTVGQLPDGRWYADRRGRGANWRDHREGACVYGAGRRGEWFAVATARRWRRSIGGEWFPAPAAYDAQGRPIDGLPWVRRGNQWVLQG